jgi:ABC-type transport system substrate-binding protein
VATQVLPPSVEGHDPSFVGQRHDLAAALEHMKKAGYPFDPATKTGGLPDPVRFVGPAESSVTEAIAPMVQQAVLRIGIRMEIVQVSYPAYLALVSRRGQVQLGYRGWTMDYPDASDFFEPILSTESIQDEESQNYSFWSNHELDLLLKKAHAELDPAARRAMYRRCEEIVRDEVPWALGYTTRWYELVQPYVHGFAPDVKHVEDVRFAWIDADERRHAHAHGRERDPLALIRPWGRR